MNENKFWIVLWSVIFTAILLGISLGVLSGYLNSKYRLDALSYEKSMIEKNLQPYTVTTCNSISITTEWHEAGWKQPIITLTPKGTL